jgi:hypothetical protein
MPAPVALPRRRLFAPRVAETTCKQVSRYIVIKRSPVLVHILVHIVHADLAEEETGVYECVYE